MQTAATAQKKKFRRSPHPPSYLRMRKIIRHSLRIAAYNGGKHSGKISLAVIHPQGTRSDYFFNSALVYLVYGRAHQFFILFTRPGIVSAVKRRIARYFRFRQSRNGKRRHYRRRNEHRRQRIRCERRENESFLTIRIGEYIQPRRTVDNHIYSVFARKTVHSERMSAFFERSEKFRKIYVVHIFFPLQFIRNNLRHRHSLFNKSFLFRREHPARRHSLFDILFRPVRPLTRRHSLFDILFRPVRPLTRLYGLIPEPPLA